MIQFHPSISLAEAKRVADELDCALVNDGAGNIVITPRDILEKRVSLFDACDHPDLVCGLALLHGRRK